MTQTFLALIPSISFSLFASMLGENILTGLKVMLSEMNLFRLNIYCYWLISVLGDKTVLYNASQRILKLAPSASNN